MLKLIDEALIFRPQLVARFVLNRCATRTVIARETAEALAEHERPVLAAASVSASALPVSRGPAGSSPSSTRPARRHARSARSPSKWLAWCHDGAVAEARVRGSS